MHLNEVDHSPLLAPPSIPPQRGEEKDKPLIWEGVGGGVLVSHLTDNRYILSLFVLNQNSVRDSWLAIATGNRYNGNIMTR
ncbi:hypothetical protein BDGGKGIB_04394 [Nodularia sphaerocarpa UHCC 0038]|nr:hypothetical protein BDGGKGIB_04394 [Nodularia sphaerocarpa UHCC 0038]